MSSRDLQLGGVCGGGCGSVGPGNKRNLLVRAYQPLCGEMERDVGEETGVVIVRMNVIVAYQALPRLMWDVFS